MEVLGVDNNNVHVPLLPDYQENTLILLVQSPRVLYVYWELSPGLKNLLEENEKVQIRLNVEDHTPFCTAELDMSQKSFYFTEVEPGHMYNCEIGIINHEKLFCPLLRSNSVRTPLDHPADVRSPAEASTNNVPSSSSWGLPKVIK
jgi:hypothetical protein